MSNTIKFQIKARFTGAVKFECEVDASLSYGRQLGAAIREALIAGANLADANLADANLARAYLAGANLADANLARAYLAGANLADANLAGANLAGANLADAYLADAYLAGANLADANLARAYLAGANLAGANLAGANLADANLADANLADANLADANLVGANLARANLADAYLADAYLARAYLVGANLETLAKVDPKDIPVVENIDAKILAAIEAGGTLNMGSWHTCETTHCRAGWAIHLAGEAGYALEKRFGPQHAGAMIYRASRPGQHAPHFFATDADALADIRKCADEQSTTPA
jgi:uncharacterized protein YjbI with pentapeptide repeats